uniref:Uncharacterized protein n=1 Tax=Anguilla anguilla TaxID=7936 RepID=A0A0E9QBI6_ANGAN
MSALFSPKGIAFHIAFAFFSFPLSPSISLPVCLSSLSF